MKRKESRKPAAAAASSSPSLHALESSSTFIEVSSLRSDRSLQWAVGLLLLAGVLSYFNSMWGVFVFDDTAEVAKNISIRTLWPPSVSMLNEGGRLPARPIPYFTFAINYALHGKQLAGYHLVNLVIHLANGLMLLGLVRRTLLASQHRFFAQAGVALFLATTIATLWTIHPITTQSVTYVYQRMESLMALCYLATLYCFIRAQQNTDQSRAWLLMSIAVCSIGMACKEVMVSAPIAVLLYDWVYGQRSVTKIAQQRSWYYASLFCTWGILGVVIWLQKSKYSEFSVERFTSPVDYALTQPAAIWLYIRLTLLPLWQCIDYGWKPSQSVAEIAPPLIALLALIVVTLVMLARAPRFGYAMAMFFLILGITSSIVPVADYVNEHRAYLAAAMVIAAVVLAVAWCVHKIAERTSVSIDSLKWPAVAVVVLLATTLGTLTHLRNTRYYSYEAMWSDCVEKAPWNLRAQRGLIVYLATTGEAKRAVALCEKMLAERPDEPERHISLAVALHLDKQHEEAAKHARIATAKSPDSDDAYYVLGLTLDGLGDRAGAIDAFRLALEIFPEFYDVNHSLGKLLVLDGKQQEGKVYLEKAVKLNPLGDDAMQDLAVTYDMLDEPQLAAAMFAKSLAMNPKNRAARDSYALLLQRLGDYQAAAEQYLLLIEEDPTDVSPRVSLAICWASLNKFSDARALLEQSERIDPTNADVQANLARVLQALGSDAQAEQHFRRALQLRPTWLEVGVSYAQMLLMSSNPAVRKPQEALKIARNATLASESKDLPSLMLLAAAANTTGHSAEARTALAQAKQLAQSRGDRQVLSQIATIESQLEMP